MRVQGINSSSKKTRLLIRNSFAELINEKKKINKVTVSELVTRAGITRGTFYTHYDNIYDVAEDFQSETIELIMADRELRSINDFNVFLDEIIAFLKLNEDTYRKLLSCDEPLVFLKRLNKLINKRLHEVFFDNHNENLDLNICFFTDGSIDLLIKYFKNEIDITLDEFCIYIKKMIKII